MSEEEKPRFKGYPMLPYAQKETRKRRPSLFDLAYPDFFPVLRELPDLRAEAARNDWNRRAEEARAGVALPLARFRIRGDSEERRWYVEEAVVSEPRPPRVGGLEIEAKIATFREDEPKAEIEWNWIKSKRTYAKALLFLREYLKPVEDESIYFTAEGHEVPHG